MGVSVTGRHDHNNNLKNRKIMDTMIWIILEWIISSEKYKNIARQKIRVNLHPCTVYSMQMQIY